MNSLRLKQFINFLENQGYQVHNFLAAGGRIDLYPQFKTILFPSDQPILRYQGSRQEILFDQERRALVGVQLLDLKALTLWQQVWAKDPFWQMKMRQTIIVGCNVSPQPRQDSSFDSALFSENILEHLRFDIFLSGDAHKYQVFSGSEDGQRLLEQFGYLGYEHIEFVGPILEQGLDPQMLKIKNKLKNRYIKKIWEPLGRRCLECGQCTIVCPTCFCFNLEDRPSLPPGTGQKVRQWTSCLFPPFSKVAGGHYFQKTTAERLFFWYYHKFVRIPEQFNLPGCVGCGRCTKVCPVGIDIRQVIKQILAS